MTYGLVDYKVIKNFESDRRDIRVSCQGRLKMLTLYTNRYVTSSAGEL